MAEVKGAAPPAYKDADAAKAIKPKATVICVFSRFVRVVAFSQEKHVCGLCQFARDDLEFSLFIVNRGTDKEPKNVLCVFCRDYFESWSCECKDPFVESKGLFENATQMADGLVVASKNADNFTMVIAKKDGNVCMTVKFTNTVGSRQFTTELKVCCLCTGSLVLFTYLCVVSLVHPLALPSSRPAFWSNVTRSRRWKRLLRHDRSVHARSE